MTLSKLCAGRELQFHRQKSNVSPGFNSTSPQMNRNSAILMLKHRHNVSRIMFFGLNLHFFSRSLLTWKWWPSRQLFFLYGCIQNICLQINMWGWGMLCCWTEVHKKYNFSVGLNWKWLRNSWQMQSRREHLVVEMRFLNWWLGRIFCWY